jgi:ribosome maturation factor RimP
MPISNADLAERLTALVGPVVEAHKVELVEVEVKGQKGSRVVRVITDTDDGVDIDVVATISRQVGDILDEDEELIDGNYTLEVSSPGVDRPLTTARQLARHVGRDLRVVRTRDAIDRGEKGEVTGRLSEMTDDDQLVLRVDKGRELRVPLGDIDYAKVVLPW